MSKSTLSTAVTGPKYFETPRTDSNGTSRWPVAPGAPPLSASEGSPFPVGVPPLAGTWIWVVCACSDITYGSPTRPSFSRSLVPRRCPAGQEESRQRLATRASDWPHGSGGTTCGVPQAPTLPTFDLVTTVIGTKMSWSLNFAGGLTLYSR